MYVPLLHCSVCSLIILFDCTSCVHSYILLFSVCELSVISAMYHHHHSPSDYHYFVQEDDNNPLTTASIFGTAKAAQEADNVIILQCPHGKDKYIQVQRLCRSGLIMCLLCSDQRYIHVRMTS